MVNAERKQTQESDFVLQLMNVREGQSVSKILILIFAAQKIKLNLSFAFVKSQNDFPLFVGKNQKKT